jgi:hypothetical protein
VPNWRGSMVCSAGRAHYQLLLASAVECALQDTVACY